MEGGRGGRREGRWIGKDGEGGEGGREKEGRWVGKDGGGGGGGGGGERKRDEKIKQDELRIKNHYTYCKSLGGRTPPLNAPLEWSKEERERERVRKERRKKGLIKRDGAKLILLVSCQLVGSSFLGPNIPDDNDLIVASGEQDSTLLVVCQTPYTT